MRVIVTWSVEAFFKEHIQSLKPFFEGFVAVLICIVDLERCDHPAK